jgi:hypothetical protein
MTELASPAFELPAELAVGGGTLLFVSGALAAEKRPPALRVRVGEGQAVPVLSISRSAGGGAWDFHAMAPIPGVRQIEAADVTLLVDGRESPLGRVELRPELAVPSFDCPTVSPGTVAVCMATHDPEPELIERQLESILKQTHDNWILLISDDSSSPEAAEKLKAVADSDSRIALSASSERLGFYRNFERALSMVPAGAEWVALSDQDDHWYPDKLESLLGAIGDAQLAYSDMRITGPDGSVIAPSFWISRRNNYENLGSLLLANTVTGAASLFRRSLLERALPFPLAPGGPFHDHWLASVALATGAIRFVERPLQDYVQHGSAALGHASAMRGYRPGRIVRPTEPRKSIERVAEHARRTYVTNACRLALQAQVLEARVADRTTPEKLRTIRRVGRLAGPREPFGWLGLRAARPVLGHSETAGIELSLLAAAIGRRVTGTARSAG